MELPLRGAGGEPVDLWRTIRSHGVADLPPMRVDEDARAAETTLALPGRRPRTVMVAAGGPGAVAVTGGGDAPDADERAALAAAVGHILRLDEDLSAFYAACREDERLAWACAGAGRMMRCQTVFEEVVKTICTTNCAWSATERMVGAIVAALGEPAPDAPADGPYGRAFPTPAAMAAAGEAFYVDVARAGYRARYLRGLAESVESGAVDLEWLGRATPEELPDDELAERLLALPGVGPYAAAHVMMMLGRYSRLILDSWTRPKYHRVVGARRHKDVTIERRFRRHGRYAGLAFWLVLTRDWVDDGDAAPAPIRLSAGEPRPG